jgi:hypothetical protein
MQVIKNQQIVRDDNPRKRGIVGLHIQMASGIAATVCLEYSQFHSIVNPTHDISLSKPQSDGRSIAANGLDQSQASYPDAALP